MKTALWITLMLFCIMSALCIILLACAIYLTVKKRFIPRFPWEKMYNPK